MPPQSSLQLIDDLIHEKRFDEALEWLEKVDYKALSQEEYGNYCLLYAKASLYVGNYKSISAKIDEAIEIFRNSLDTKSFAQAKYLKGWLFSALGSHLDAEEALIEAYSNFSRCNYPTGCARSLNWLSYVAFQRGNMETAISSLQKCVDIFRSLQEKSNEFVVSMNLSALYFRAGKLNDSLSKYKEIHSSVLQQGDNNIVAYYNMSAIPYALKGNIETARKTIAKAEPYIDKFVREKAIYYENLGLINILDGKYADAEKALKAGIKISMKIAPESALVAQIKRLYGDLYVTLKKYNLAEQYAQEALQVAEKINERVEIAACYRVFAEVEKYRGHVNKSQEWYLKAIDLFRVIESRYELAVTRYMAAISDMFDNNTRTALLYMAREYFSQEGVDHYFGRAADAIRQTSFKVSFRSPVYKDAPPEIITVNREMRRLVTLAEKIATTDLTVLLTGETGTGKDLMAEFIHYHSGRSGELVPINAAAVPSDLIEAELFGYKKGAFTNANEEKVGLLETAQNGTFYLNEIAEASLDLQAKLLEVLETHKVRRLGETELKPVNFRLIAATNRDLKELVRQDKFRADLYHRLREIPINLPPLRHRREDIPLLVRRFLTFAGFDMVEDGSEESLRRLGELFQRRYWRGNIRELRAEVRHLWILGNQRASLMLHHAIERSIDDERDELMLVLEETNWNRRETARRLGISDTTVRSRIKKYKLKEPY